MYAEYWLGYLAATSQLLLYFYADTVLSVIARATLSTCYGENDAACRAALDLV